MTAGVGYGRPARPRMAYAGIRLSEGVGAVLPAACRLVKAVSCHRTPKWVVYADDAGGNHVRAGRNRAYACRFFHVKT